MAIGLPSRQVATSAGLGWAAVEAHRYADPPVADEFHTRSERLLVVLVTSGRYRIESRHGASWRRAAYRPGSLGITAPGQPSELRWRSIDGAAMESVHLHLDPAPARGAGFPDSLALHDQFATASTQALDRALRAAAPALYADSLAQTLVLHLARLTGRAPRPDRRPEVSLSSADVDRVVEHMRARLGDDLTLDELAAVARVSKFHFIRAFALATGSTPYRMLRSLRMRAAAELLRTTSHTVARVAVACGYRSAGQFARAFRTEFGASPSEFRNMR